MCQPFPYFPHILRVRHGVEHSSFLNQPFISRKLIFGPYKTPFVAWVHFIFLHLCPSLQILLFRFIFLTLDFTHREFWPSFLVHLFSLSNHLAHWMFTFMAFITFLFWLEVVKPSQQATLLWFLRLSKIFTFLIDLWKVCLKLPGL